LRAFLTFFRSVIDSFLLKWLATLHGSLTNNTLFILFKLRRAAKADVKLRIYNLRKCLKHALMKYRFIDKVIFSGF